ncbi:glycyl-radical enzyme activating protein [Clostridium sp. MCC353]|uniref:glycyl-radical enzyme activating protein n=1 Tax=Clostridium sp. MCC353 TaxID=2592646 RepID=UPI001C0131B1|nr:glycyl-radical enzyme activating protein [Clostridium sp. MCC353]MBT9776712.1 glycyl-radical enzyme activating protein [Clostridium sp. MCC353]
MEGYRGTVFNIQKFSIHDGPGIRTTVFLKGCPLRCKWCHNPESNESCPQLMFHSKLCTGCGNCVAVCPEQCISIVSGTGKSYTDFSRCRNCGACASELICEHGARSLAGHETTAEEIVAEAIKDKIYFKASGGGVTFSGGEPLMQPHFTAQALRKCREAGISTAVETCGFASWNMAELVFKEADYILYDIKHMDSETHKALTGVGNEQILENLNKAVKELNKRVWLRLPLIKGVNDSAGEIEAVARLAESLGGMVEQIWLLPYHNLGLSKLEALNMPDQEMKQFQAPEQEELERMAKVLEVAGAGVKIG